MLKRLTPDRIGGLLWLAFGIVVSVASWRMDRLESQNIPLATVPGLLPGLLGIGLAGLGLVLLLRRGPPALPSFAEEPAGAATETASSTEPESHWGRLVLSWLICVAYAGLALGRGLPFWLLTAVFVVVHIVVLDDPDRIERMSLARRALVAALVAAGTAALVTFVFGRVFLIRLP